MLGIMSTIWTTLLIIGSAYCGYIGRDERITWLKQHSIDDYPDVAKWKQVPMEIYKLFQDKLQWAKDNEVQKKAKE